MKTPLFIQVKVTVAFLTCNQTLVKVSHPASAPTIRACEEAVTAALELACEKYLAGREAQKLNAPARGRLGGQANQKINGHG